MEPRKTGDEEGYPSSVKNIMECTCMFYLFPEVMLGLDEDVMLLGFTDLGLVQDIDSWACVFVRYEECQHIYTYINFPTK